MANTGNVFVATGENNAGIGATAWSNPGNIVSDNTTDATCAAAASSQYLVGRNCGFSIPSTATIRGVLVRVEASEHTAGTEPLLAQLQNDLAALFGSSKSTSNQGSISGTAKAVYTYGSISDPWGATLTPAIVNDADFGVRFWFTTAHDIRVDYVTIQIEYSTLTAQAITATAIGVAAMSDRVTYKSLLGATAVGVAVLTTKLVFHQLMAAVAIGIASLSTRAVFHVTAAATAIGLASLSMRSIYRRSLAAVATGLASLSTVFQPGPGDGAGNPYPGRFLRLGRRRKA